MTSPSETHYELPAKVEGYLATLSKFYARKKEELLQRIVVNASYTVEEGKEYDNWNGGQTGHLIRLAIPAILFLDTMDTLAEVEKRITSDLNSIAKCPNEHVSAVAVEPAETEDIRQWREKSGALLTLQKSEKDLTDATERLWKKGYFKAFLSHKAEYKKEAAKLKTALAELGISAFVAHEDIVPTREWQDEIELALSTMDVCVALLTDQFHDSNWTDQEVGVAIGRGVPIVAVRLGKDPYGFIGKFQGVPGAGKTSEDIAVELMRCVLANQHLRQRMAAGLVFRFENADDFAHAKRLMGFIKGLTMLSPDLIERLEEAPKHNSQIKDSWGVTGSLASVIARLRRK